MIRYQYVGVDALDVRLSFLVAPTGRRGTSIYGRCVYGIFYEYIQCIHIYS